MIGKNMLINAVMKTMLNMTGKSILIFYLLMMKKYFHSFGVHTSFGKVFGKKYKKKLGKKLEKKIKKEN